MKNNDLVDTSATNEVIKRINAITRKNRVQTWTVASVAGIGTAVIPLAFLFDGATQIAMDMTGRAMVISAVFLLAGRAINTYRQLIIATEKFTLVLATAAELHSDDLSEQKEFQARLLTTHGMKLPEEHDTESSDSPTT